MMHRKLLSILFLLVTLSLSAQTAKDEAKLAERLNTYFAKYKPKGTRLTQAPRMVLLPTSSLPVRSLPLRLRSISIKR